MPQLLRELPGPNMGTVHTPRITSTTLLLGHRQVIWEWLWRSRCEWIGWRKVMADCVFQTAAAVMIWFQTAKRLVISVRHSGALIR